MDDTNMHAYGEDAPDDAEIGRRWREDSSLAKWFPLTAEKLAAKERENLHLAREARTWWDAAQTYAADADRLRAALQKIEAGNCIDPRTVARDALGPNVVLTGAAR
jgi:hypothetical protein